MALLATTDVHWEAGGLSCISQWSRGKGVTHLTLSLSASVLQSPSTGVRPLSLVPVLGWDEVGPLKSQTLASSRSRSWPFLACISPDLVPPMSSSR